MSHGTLADIEIQLAPFEEAKHIPSKGDCAKVIRDVYAERYLEQLGIDSSHWAKQQVLRRAPLDECQIEAAWGNKRSLMADRLRIRQPALFTEHKEEVEEEETSVETEGRVSQSRVGFTGYIKPLLDFKLPYQVPTEKEPSTKRELPFLGGGATAWLPTNDTDVELTHQLERQRMQARNKAHGSKTSAENNPLLVMSETKLQDVKRKFLLPFAAEQPVSGSMTETEIRPWLLRETMPLEVTEHIRQARQPISVSSEEIRKECTKLTKGQLPLELLTRRPKPQILRALRVRILCADQVRLVGLLSHWLYWKLLGHLHEPFSQLPETKMEALVISVQEVWAALILPFQETPVGVGFAVPALLLATKMLVEEIFKKQYPDVFRPAPSQQHLWEEINIMCMKHLDSDCTFAHFAALDLQVEGSKLWRKLQASLETKQSSVARAQAKACRTSALLLRALSGGSGCADSRTRRFLAKGASERGELVEPGTKENSKEEALRRAQHERWRSRALLRQASVARPASAEEILVSN
ncbi:Uncharacterized protein SCF082_LOCUS12215 [Durusdinium trenchii]|uniref:Uncharacterized protein n=1 Tax=Durusdinium trenchii TaxID=1381693 RepID=A0ABP0JI78_9DINO